MYKTGQTGTEHSKQVSKIGFLIQIFRHSPCKEIRLSNLNSVEKIRVFWRFTHFLPQNWGGLSPICIKPSWLIWTDELMSNHTLVSCFSQHNNKVPPNFEILGSTLSDYNVLNLRKLATNKLGNFQGGSV